MEVSEADIVEPETWDDLEAYAIGNMRLLPEVYENMTWQEYEYARYGYRLNKIEQWQHTRKLMHTMVNLVASKHIPETQLFTLPTDPKSTEKTMTDEEFWDYLVSKGRI